MFIIDCKRTCCSWHDTAVWKSGLRVVFRCSYQRPSVISFEKFAWMENMIVVSLWIWPSKCAEWEIVICSKHWCPGHVFGPQNAVFMIFRNFLVIWCPYQIEKVMSFEGKCMNGNHGSHISFNKCDQRACRVEGYVNIVAMVKYLVVEMLLYFMFSVLSPWFDAPCRQERKNHAIRWETHESKWRHADLFLCSPSTPRAE